MLKRAQPVATPAPSTVTLPRTATDAELKMIAGVILLTLSLTLLVFNRRQEEVLPTSSSSLGNFMARIETQRRLAIILRSAALSRLRVP